MCKKLESLHYTTDEIARLEAYIAEALSQIDAGRIGDRYQIAMKQKDQSQAIAALADYYRNRPAVDIPYFNGGPYSKAHADQGAAGHMREVSVDYDFPDGRIRFLFNPTLEKPPVNHEWLWQLNRHSWWSSMARAYADTKEEGYAKAFNTQLLDWAAQTTIPQTWNGPGSAFRTIECGIRLLGSWQTSFSLFRHSSHVWDETLVVMLGAFHVQACHLLAHPTGGNWLLMETGGMYNVGSLFPEFRDAGDFRSAGQARVLEEIQTQLLPDGFQYELSPDYHNVSLGCLQNMYRTALATGQSHEFPKAYTDAMYRMMMVTVQMSTPGFTQPRTNDCYTIRTRQCTGFAEKIFPEEPVFRFVSSDRREGCPPAGETASVFLPWSGYAVMRSDWTGEATYLCFDVGPLGMGHWHQDKLNIHLYKGAEELIFDDGGGQYEQSPERKYGLSAFDHNTVTVDGMGQNRPGPKKCDAEIDAGWITNDIFDYACGTYADSFGEGQHPAVHKREVRFCKPSFYVVRDTLTSADGQPHTYGLRFHMDTLDTQILASGAVLAQYGKTWDLLLVPIADDGEVSGGFTAHSGETSPLCGWYIGRNAEKNHPATTVIQESASVHTHHFTTLLIPFRHGTALPEVTRNPDGMVTVALAGEICRVDLTHLDR